MADHASSAREALTAALTDRYGRVRVNAAGALWAMETPRRQLMPALDEVVSGRDASDAAEAADLLIRMGREPKEFTETLLRAMSDFNVETRKGVMDNIREQKKDSPDYIPVLLRGLVDRDEGVRSSAASELGSKTYATPEVVAALQRATSDRSEYVRSSAARSLSTVGTPAGAPAKPGAATPAKPGAAPPGSAEIDSVTATLLRSLTDRKSSVRAEAAESLGDMKKSAPEVISALRACLKDKDNDVKSKAAEALGEIGKPAKEAIPDLWAIWKDPKQDTFVKHAAGRALGNLGEKVNWKE
jgi:HEAT repeat protein